MTFTESSNRLTKEVWITDLLQLPLSNQTNSMIKAITFSKQNNLLWWPLGILFLTMSSHYLVNTIEPLPIQAKEILKYSQLIGSSWATANTSFYKVPSVELNVSQVPTKASHFSTSVTFFHPNNEPQIFLSLCHSFHSYPKESHTFSEESDRISYQ